MDAAAFQPDLGRRRRPGGRVTVVALSRLVYRKGVDLLNVVIPAVCRRQPHVDFIIGARAKLTPMRTCYTQNTTSYILTIGFVAGRLSYFDKLRYSGL